jgi:hypothetical protein
MHFISQGERSLALAILCLLVQAVQAQLRDPFAHLSLQMPAGSFFFPQSHNTIKVPNPYSWDNELTASQCATLFMSMSRASVDSTLAISDFSGFREHKDSVAHREGCLSLALLDIHYFDFRSDALTEGIVYRDAGHFYHTEGCAQSPCITKEAFAVWPDAPHIQAKEYRFLFRSENHISNYDMHADSITIDFDDGLGWRTLEAGTMYTVDYSSEARDRVVKCVIKRQGYSDKYASCRLMFLEEYDVCEGVSEMLPNYPPWFEDTPNPWDVTTDFDGEEVKGRAYTLISNDGMFDKPFLFVEGIDFGLDRDGHSIHDWLRHGTFGWCEFASGFQDPDVNDDIVYGYDDLQHMPQIIEAIRLEGFDIVLIDFYDGAGWLEQNSLLVQHVIRLCNEFKVGNEPIVVAGASMGGVITRHALRSMELNGEDHCARLWISMDAPHEGAHIPVSLQHAIRFSEEQGQEQAQLFRDRYLLRPAARQMLDAQVFSDLNDHNDWYNQLREMGYPEKCRSVALSNGLANGQGLEYSEYPLMDWECDALGMVHSKILLLPESGDPYNEYSLPNFPVLAHFRSPTVGIESIGDEWYYWLGGLSLGLIDAVDMDEEILYTTQGIINRDYAPGGKRNTLQIFAAALNEGLSELEENLYWVDICSDVNPSQYNPDHSFVSSPSSVGVLTDDPYQNLNEFLWQHPDENHFDEVWFASDHNENHTEITLQKVDLVLNEVIAASAVPLDTSLSSSQPNDGVFNFGRPEYSYLHSVHIHQDGQLHINAMTNTHFNGDLDYLSTQNHFVVHTTPCSPEVVLVDQGGLLSIGDSNEEYRTGELVIGRDARLVVGAGGEVIVQRGSTLRVEDGGKIEILPGGVLKSVSGNIEIDAGAVCEYYGTEGSFFSHHILLEGNDARFLLSGGNLVIDDYTELRLNNGESINGFFEVSSGLQSTVQLGHASALRLLGENTSDLLLHVKHGARLVSSGEMNGVVELANGWVDLTDNGSLHVNTYLAANNVYFYANDQWPTAESEVRKSNASSVLESCTMQNCSFEHVDLHVEQCKLTLLQCEFSGPHAGVEIQEGAYLITASSFEDAHCLSLDLQANSVVSDCLFGHNSTLNDWSEHELKVQRSLFMETELPAIEKTGGTLTLRCNDFKACGAVVLRESKLDMSTLINGGLNTFYNVSDCIQLIDAGELYMDEGNNNFSGCLHQIVEGTVAIDCENSYCELEVIATHNHWGYNVGGLSNAQGLIFPPSDLIHVQSSQSDACGGYESGTTCMVSLLDAEPIEPITCHQAGKNLQSMEISGHQSNWTEVVLGIQPAVIPCMVRLYDVHGRIIGLQKITEGEYFQMERFSVSSGIYLVEVSDSTGNASFRRVVE